MTTLSICAIIALLVYCIINTGLIVRTNKAINKLWRIHDNFVDHVNDAFDDTICQANRSIDDTNVELNNINDTLIDIIDTMELMCDTDEAMIKKINTIKDENDYMWDVLEEHDDILYSFFEDCPEEVEEEEEKPAKKSKKK